MGRHQSLRVLSMEATNPLPILATCGIEHPQQVTRVTGGNDTLLWKVVDARGLFALRLLRAEQQAGWHGELQAMQTAAGAGIPVPTIHRTLIWQERPVILMDWSPGEPVAIWLARRPWRLWQLGQAMGRMQAQIHRIVLPVDWQQPADPWVNFADPRDAAIKEHLLALPPRPPTLLHFDFHPMNVLSDGRGITAVLDWTNAATGDARADFARTYAIFQLDPWEGRTSAPWQLFRRLLITAWRRGYEQIQGPQEDLTLFYAWAGAVMVRDLAPRAHPDHAPTPAHIAAMQRWTDQQKRRAGIE